MCTCSNPFASAVSALLQGPIHIKTLYYTALQSTHRDRIPRLRVLKRVCQNVVQCGSHSENQLKIQSHFYRVHACFVTYFLMTEKLQQIRKLAYIPSLGPGGLLVLQTKSLARLPAVVLCIFHHRSPSTGRRSMSTPWTPTTIGLAVFPVVEAMPA